jgi:hypothetical protein
MVIRYLVIASTGFVADDATYNLFFQQLSLLSSTTKVGDKTLLSMFLKMLLKRNNDFNHNIINSLGILTGIHKASL